MAPARRKTLGAPKGSSRAPPHMVPRRTAAFITALKAAKVPYERHLYPGTQHGFNNDTTPRFDAAAAKLSWERTLAHFNKHLR